MAARLEQLLDTFGRRRRAIALPTALLASFLLLAALASSANAGDRVYWANGGFAPERFSFANLDGSAGRQSQHGRRVDRRAPRSGDGRGGGKGLLDEARHRAREGRISFANLDGSGGGGDLNTSGATVNLPNAAAVYPAARKIYWANEGGDKISFANLDNTGGGDLTHRPARP